MTGIRPQHFGENTYRQFFFGHWPVMRCDLRVQTFEWITISSIEFVPAQTDAEVDEEIADEFAPWRAASWVSFSDFEASIPD